MSQADLFDEAFAGPPGLCYEAGFLSVEEEAALVRTLAGLPWQAARYRDYTAQRRVVSYGSRYDFGELRLHAAEPLPAWLLPLRARVAAWAGVPEGAFIDALAAEYPPGTPLGWHRDVPEFERVVGVSLAGAARLRWRRYRPDAPEPPDPQEPQDPREDPTPPVRPVRRRDKVWSLDVAPRSIYRISGEARWGWQHSVAPTPALRYSLTFRTRRAG